MKVRVYGFVLIIFLLVQTHISQAGEVKTYIGDCNTVIGRVVAIKFSLDNKYLLASAGSDANLWDITTGRKVQTFSHKPESDDWIDDIAYSHDGKYVLTATAQEAILWDTATGKQLHTFPSSDKKTPDAMFGSFTPNGKYILTANALGGALWDIEDSSHIRDFPAKIIFESHKKVELSPDGEYVITNGAEGAVLWELETGTLMHDFGKHLEAAFSPDGKYIFLQGPGDEGEIVDSKTFQQVHVIDKIFGFPYWNFSPDGHYLYRSSVISADTSVLEVWDSQQGRKLWGFVKQFMIPNLIEFSANSKHILFTEYIFSSDRYKYHVWDIQNNTEITNFLSGDLTVVAFTSDGKYFVGGDTAGHLEIRGLPSYERLFELC